MHAGPATLCMMRYRQLKASHPERATRYRTLILPAARQYLDTDPPANVLIKPDAFAKVITLMLNAHELTKGGAFLDRADHFAQIGIGLFLGDGLPLPKATNRNNHYETITGGPSFMLALLDLCEAK
jgi:hypothetical protein